MCGSVIVDAYRANKVAEKGMLPTFRTKTGDDAAYFNKVSRDAARVYL